MISNLELKRNALEDTAIPVSHGRLGLKRGIN